jgi:hypothetical protein
MKHLLPAFALFVFGCATPADPPPQTANATLARATLEEVRAIPAFAAIGRTGNLAVTLPAHARAPMRVDHQGVTLDLLDEVAESATNVVDGAAIAHLEHVDVLFAAAGERAEEVRVLRDGAAPDALRWTLRVTGATAKRVEDRVELLDDRGVPRLAIEPLFAIDARGVRRELSSTLARVDDHTWTLEAHLDRSGLAYPIYVDPIVTPWIDSEPMSTARLGHTATLLKDGRVLVVGGASSEGGAALSTAEIWSNSSTGGGFAAAAAMSTARVHHTATLLGDGRVLVIGGTAKHGAAPVVSTAEIYDPVANSWSSTSAMPTARAWHTANVLGDGTVLVAGGAKELLTPADVVLPPLVFSPATKTFTTMTAFGANVFAGAISVQLADGAILYLGGVVGVGCSPGACSSRDVVAFDPAAKKFTKVGSLRRPRAFDLEDSLVAASTFEKGTQVLVIGGGDDSGELWKRDSAGTWFTDIGGELSDPWSAPAMVTTPAGDAVATGGFVASPDLPATPVKLFPTGLVRHHATGKWADAAPPTHRRWSHTATALGDGTILLTGGRNKDAALALAETWKSFELGHACKLGGDCASANCVDGVCCEAACDGQCEACNKDGKCVPVTGAPRGVRPLGVDPGGDVCKAQTCNGSEVAACNLPKGNECAAAACSGSTFTAAGTCDGAGACSKPAPKECKPFGCSDTGCRTSCTTASDCANGFTCSGGACIEASGTTCKPDLTAAVTKDGKELACEPYLCQLSTGACGDSCASSAQCAGGFVCNASKCEPPPAASGDSGGGCSVSRGSKGIMTGSLFALVTLGLLSRRRRA